MLFYDLVVIGWVRIDEVSIFIERELWEITGGTIKSCESCTRSDEESPWSRPKDEDVRISYGEAKLVELGNGEEIGAIGGDEEILVSIVEFHWECTCGVTWEEWWGIEHGKTFSSNRTSLNMYILLLQVSKHK